MSRASKVLREETLRGMWNSYRTPRKGPDARMGDARQRWYTQGTITEPNAPATVA